MKHSKLLSNKSQGDQYKVSGLILSTAKRDIEFLSTQGVMDADFTRAEQIRKEILAHPTDDVMINRLTRATNHKGEAREAVINLCDLVINRLGRYLEPVTREVINAQNRPLRWMRNSTSALSNVMALSTVTKSARTAWHSRLYRSTKSLIWVISSR